MKKMWKYAAVVLVCVLTLGACGNLDSSKTSGDAAQDRKIQIGMSFDSFVIERWQTDRDIFVSTAKELGAEVIVQNANGDLEQQKKQINYFIDKGMIPRGWQSRCKRRRKQGLKSSPTTE